LFCVAFCSVGPTHSQTFSSESTGADGALNLTTPGTLVFDPKAFQPALNPAGDNIFNFTTINIASGVTVRLSGKILTGPVYWLAQGAVQIAGTIDISGGGGHAAGNNLSDRIQAAPGAGGYGGGMGGDAPTGRFPPTAGSGPGRGDVVNIFTGEGRGTFTGSQFLIPLIGGSGGGGVQSVFGCGNLLFGGGGGAGGGALLIASSNSITVTGTINANGGPAGCDGASGSGGAIRLIAPTIAGTGTITAAGATACCFNIKSGDGRIRLEAFQQNFTGGFNGTPTSQSPPFKLVLPATPPSSIRVTSVAGIPINANPFSFPDAVINSSKPVLLTIEARYVPLGTVPTLFIFSENVGDQVITAPALAGTLQLSTTSVNVTIPSGGSRGFVKATW
jgi:hypothetical protein